MKRCRKLVMGLSLVLAMTFLIGTTSFAGEYSLCFVNTEGGNLNCRSGPGTEYSIVGKFKNGTQLGWSIFGGIDSLGREWTYVDGKDINGKLIMGWVLDSYLRYEDNPNSIIPAYKNENMPDVV